MQAEQASQWSFNSLREREKTWLRDFDSQKQFSSPSFVPGYEPASFSIIDAARILKLNAFVQSKWSVRNVHFWTKLPLRI